jgi:acyl-CoA thioester hydrolase
MKLELPAKKFVHAMTIPIRWGDMDAMGHVNNTVYFRYLESARIEWMRIHRWRAQSGRRRP